MKKNQIVTNVKKSVIRTFHKAHFQIQKKSPEILVAFGIISGVGGAILACKATVKACKVKEETKETLDTLQEAEAKGVTNAGESYSEDDYKKDVSIVRIQTGVKYIKLYAPSVTLGVLSVTSILAGHKIMKKRNVALAAAYAEVCKSFKEYRNRVLDRFGEHIEKELRYNVKAQEVEKKIVDENGQEQTLKETADVVQDGFDPTKLSPYAKCFDETHPDWIKDAEQNLFYLKARQSQANDMLQARGHLFLNEVYDLLNFPRTKAGAVVGWIYDPKNPVGDNYVDFGIFNAYRSKNRDFVNGYEPAIWLDFNASGDILDYIADHQFI